MPQICNGLAQGVINLSSMVPIQVLKIWMSGVIFNKTSKGQSFFCLANLFYGSDKILTTMVLTLGLTKSCAVIFSSRKPTLLHQFNWNLEHFSIRTWILTPRPAVALDSKSHSTSASPKSLLKFQRRHKKIIFPQVSVDEEFGTWEEIEKISRSVCFSQPAAPGSYLVRHSRFSYIYPY